MHLVIIYVINEYNGLKAKFSKYLLKYHLYKNKKGIKFSSRQNQLFREKKTKR